MRLTLGLSTCPNDTFIFDALVNGKIDNEGLLIDVIMTDVEELNRKAVAHSIDITKLSYHAYAYVAHQYTLLNAGSAMGRGNGPLLISRNRYDEGDVKNLKIAIPGLLTTANLLFMIFYPEALHKKEYLFSDIEEALLSGEADAGVIIHENRFTYRKKGLNRIADLGNKWEKATGMPIPLGGIVADRRLPLLVRQKFDRLLHKSVVYALEHPESSADFVKKYSNDLNDSVIRKHINLYVNNFTAGLGDEGRKAVTDLFRIAEEKKIIPAVPDGFLPDY